MVLYYGRWMDGCLKDRPRRTRRCVPHSRPPEPQRPTFTETARFIQHDYASSSCSTSVSRYKISRTYSSCSRIRDFIQDLRAPTQRSSCTWLSTHSAASQNPYLSHRLLNALHISLAVWRQCANAKPFTFTCQAATALGAMSTPRA